MDETTELCKYILPSHHWLESWGDAEGQAGFVSLIQPLIHPLFKTRQFEDSLLKWTGTSTAVAGTDSIAIASKPPTPEQIIKLILKITGLLKLEVKIIIVKHYRMV